MKRLNLLPAFLLMLCLALPGFAAQESAAPLTREDLLSFTGDLISRAREEEAVPFQGEEGGFVAEGIGYSIDLLSEDISEDTVLTGAEINMGSIHVEGLTGPRGLGATSSLQEVLGAYLNDNPGLKGSMTGAVLYISGGLPGETAIGQVVRDGQNVILVEHSLLIPTEGGVSHQGLQYLFEEGYVTAVRYFGGAELLTMEDAQAALQQAAQLQEDGSYFAYDSQEPSPFAREDLVFRGMDFLDMTPETAQSVLGEVVHEETVKDSTGDEIRIMQWEGVEITFIYKPNGDFVRADRITVSQAGLEGPRGLRVGTTLPAALSRFVAGEQGQDASVSLWGDPQGQTAPFGRLDREGAEARLYCAIEQDGQRLLFSVLFYDNALVEMSAGY